MSSGRPGRERLDHVLVERGMAESRQKAQALIRTGRVRVDGTLVEQPAFACPAAAQIEVQAGLPFVSRGGEKLAGALALFPVVLTERVCLDAGISTGGFTDCLLQRGASRVYGVDVGYGQVAWKLRIDPRVVLKERTNIRYLTPDQLYSEGDPRADLATVDVSFISVRLLLPVLAQLLAPPRDILILVKPQFEAGRGRVGKHGVVRDPGIHREVITAVWQSAQLLNWQFRGLTGSPLTGPAGNHEYWLWLADTGAPELSEEQIAQSVRDTLGELL